MTDIFGNNMNILRRSLLYDQVSQKNNNNDDEDDNNHHRITIPNNWRDYPALRPNSLVGVKPRKGVVLVKTGGNALQALDRTAFEQPDVMAVTVPTNTTGGDEMLVRLPLQGRLIRTIVPEGMQPGHVFLMRVPPPPPPPPKDVVAGAIQEDVDGHDLQLEEVEMSTDGVAGSSTVVSGVSGGSTTTYTTSYSKSTTTTTYLG